MTSALVNGTPLTLDEQAQSNAPSRMVYSTLNPGDGAVLTYTPDSVTARSQTGDVLTLYRRPLNYSLQTNNATIADLATGEIAAYENGALVTIDPHKNVSVKYPNGYTHSLGVYNSQGFDAQDVLVGRHILDAQTYGVVKALEDNSGDMSKVPLVRNDFGSSTNEVLAQVQRTELEQRYGTAGSGIAA
jgi:hypothetical protein